MEYKKDLHILGYTSNEALLSVSKNAFTNQQIKVILNKENGDFRLANKFDSKSLNSLKYETNKFIRGTGLQTLISIINKTIPSIKNVSLKLDTTSRTANCEVKYSIFDQNIKNQSTNTYKFILDK